MGQVLLEKLGHFLAKIDNASVNSAAEARRDRALGAFLGLAIGDAPNSTIEFSRRDSLPPVTDIVGGGPFGLKPGEWTDDTSMALCLAESLVAKGGALDDADLADRFGRWWKNGENSVKSYCFDIGGTTRAPLASFQRKGRPNADRSPSAAGNGGIIRLAPAAVAANDDVAKAVALARGQSEVTHAALECPDAESQARNGTQPRPTASF